MKKTKNIGRKIVKVLFFIVILIIIAAIIWFVSVYYSAKLDEKTLVTKKASVRVLNKNEDLIESDFLYKYVPYSSISPHLIHAFVALEDKRFFKHKGIDYYRTFGALAKDLSTFSFREGGSTITQQLAKNTQLSQEKTIQRKIKEMRIARLIENKYTKEQIMEMYLNAIYFGNGIYGIDCAAKVYFNKQASELTAAESATLAGIVKNPSKYSPKKNLPYATERRNLVLRLMYEQKYLDESAYKDALQSSYCFRDTHSINNVFPFYNNVLSEAAILLQKNQQDVILSSYTIYTGYDPILQDKICLSALSDDFIPKAETYDSSVLIADNESGEINAFYATCNLDIYTYRRQPASTIKPILVYAPAIESNIIAPESPVLDEPIDIDGYSPNNFGKNFLGWTTAQNALAYSVNTVAVKIFDETGKDYCKKFAENCGLSLDPRDSLSSALGGLTYGITQAELTESYMTLANEGLRKKVHLIRKIMDKDGNTIYRFKPGTSVPMSKDTAFLTTTMLLDTVQKGTAQKLKGFPYDIASKTGTAQKAGQDGNSDAWNVSYTTQNTMLVWYGDTSEQSDYPGLQMTGSGIPSLLARKMYSEMPKPQQIRFTPPSTVFQIEIDTFAAENDHLLYSANRFTPAEYRKKAYFSLQNAPYAVSPYFDVNNVRFTISGARKEKTITVYAEEDYSYILQEKNVLSGETKEYSFPCRGTYIIRNETDLPSVIIYKLEIYYHGKKLSDIPPNNQAFDSLMVGKQFFPRVPARFG